MSEPKQVPVEPVATVINNNQPGWAFIAETEPNVTLDVGTKLYAAAPEKTSGDLQTALNALAALVGSNDVCELRQMRDELRPYAAVDLDAAVSVAAISALIGLLERHPLVFNLHTAIREDV